MPPSLSRSSVLASFGERLRQLRTAASLSQEGLADACGLDRTYVSGVERGKRNISLKNIAAISEALGISISKMTEGL